MDDVRSMGDKDRRMVRSKVERLQNNARPPGCLTLPIAEHFYRVKTGRWRIFYFVDDAQRRAIIARVKLRDKATYKDLI